MPRISLRTDSHTFSARSAIGLLAALALTLTLGVTAIGLSTSAGAANISESEPNNSASTADSLPLGATVTGKTQTDYSYDEDYYYVPISAAGRANLEFKFPANLSGDAYNVAIYDAQINKRLDVDLLGADSSGAWTSRYAVFVTGSIYVRIYGRSSSPTWGKAYTLRVTHTPGLVESENNNTANRATTLPLGSTIQGSTLTDYSYDEDYYYVPISAAGRANLEFKFPANLSGDAYNVAIYDAQINKRLDVDLLGADSSGAWTSRYAVFVTGSIYVRIYGRSSSPTWGKAYTLRVTHTPGLVESENNNTANRATTLPLGSTIQGSTLTDYSYDEDYYFVPSAKSRRVAIDFRFPKGLRGEAYYIKLQDVRGNDLINEISLLGSQFSGAWGRKLSVRVPAGGLYVRIYGRSSSQVWGRAYTLRVANAITTKTPTIAGTKRVGKKLTARPGKWSPAKLTLSYQWYRNGKAIKKAKKKSYKLTAKDRGKRISVKVTAKKSGYYTISKSSKKTAKIKKK